MYDRESSRRLGATRRTIVAALMAACCMPAAAQNTVQNPNFTTELAPWTLFVSGAPDPVGSGSATWTASEDAGGALGSSGAAEIVLDAAPAEAHAASGIRQCVSFAQTTVLQANYGVRVKIPGTDTADGSVGANVEIRFFSDPGCSDFIPGAGGTQGRAIVAGVPDDAFWYSIGDPAFVLPVDALAQSAEVRASLRKIGSASQPYTAYFDDIYLSLNGSVPVSLQSFDVE